VGFCCSFTPVIYLSIRIIFCCVFCVLILGLQHARATEQSGGRVIGAVADQLGVAIPATVLLVQDDTVVAEVQTDERGMFRFDGILSGHYRVEARAEGFERALSEPVYVVPGGVRRVSLMLSIGPVTQYVVVTAAATELPQAQSGSPTSVITGDTLEQFATSDVLDGLRMVPATSVVQTGGRGGAASVFIRGGAADFNKVLVDGVSVNDIGGAFDWDSITTIGIDRVEVLRTSNSVLYGGDTLGGVINLTTPRGMSETPDIRYTVDGGTFGSLRNELSVGGLAGRFDYFVAASRFDTDNELPNNAFRNTTGVGRFGVFLGSATDLSVTLRRIDTHYGSPGAMLFYGIPDDSSQVNKLRFASVNARTQVTKRLQTDIQFGSLDRAIRFNNPTPTGEGFDPFGFGQNYLGNELTIIGANGFQTTGRAIVDYGGYYPSVFEADTTRRFLSGRAHYFASDSFDVSSGVRIEREVGTSRTVAEIERTNVGSFIEARTRIGRRFYLTGGVGFDRNGLFGSAATPRAAIAVYLRNPTTGDTALGDTKLTFNVGSGIKAPSVFDEQSALYTLLGEGSDLATEFGIEAIGPERSRNIDVGIEQTLGGSRARLRIAYFDNKFFSLVEFVNNLVLPQLGVPLDVAATVPFGATVNASSYTARGIETSADMQFVDVRLAGTYTFVDAEVTESFSSSALNPAFNPAFPEIQIGQFAPLVGARPFRRPTHVGSVLVSYVRGRMQVSVTGFLVGKVNDSTFLSDAFFGPSMLLPNEDLTAGYQKVDLSGSYRLHRRLSWHVRIANLLDQQYAAVIGFPSLPRMLWTGVSVALGGV